MDAPPRLFKTRKAWRTWLSRNHDRSKGIWLAKGEAAKSNGSWPAGGPGSDGRPQASMIWSGGFVFHLPRVKSGMATGRPLPATLFTLAPTTALQAAAS